MPIAFLLYLDAITIIAIAKQQTQEIPSRIPESDAAAIPARTTEANAITIEITLANLFPCCSP